MQRTIPISLRQRHLPTPGQVLASPSVRTGALMVSTGVVLAMLMVWLEDTRQLDFAIGLTIGFALMPWLMTFVSATSRMLPQPGAICAIVLGSGTYLALAGLFSDRPVAFGIGGGVIVGALTVWIAASRSRQGFVG
ncbi:MAG: hypothetical protein WKF81_02485 [Thermomicrobiales bacterium]